MANILLLEDDESLNRGISLKLQKEGYQVFSAFGVTEAKQIFGSQKIDLIISDITMKDGNGLDAGDDALWGDGTWNVPDAGDRDRGCDRIPVWGQGQAICDGRPSGKYGFGS